MPSSFYIVTGSTRGMGKALCNTILRGSQSKVVGLARSSPTIDHPNYTHVQMDLTDVEKLTAQDALAPVFNPVPPNVDRLVLINSAGQLHTAYMGRCDAKKFANMVTCNMLAPALLCDGFVKRFQGSQGSRVIINVSSGAATNNYDGWAGYCATKAALDRMSQVLQVEQDLHQTGIRVFSVHPGPTETDMQAELRKTTEDHFLLRTSDRSPRKMRIASPEATARRILAVAQDPDRFPEVLVDSAILRAVA